MKKVIRTISYVLTIVLVFALIPAINVFAARGRVQLGESKATVRSSYELKVGESVDLNFYGATGYTYKTDRKSIFWKSSDSGIVSVDEKGLITAVAPGTATISMTVTVAKTKTSYEGSVTVKVLAVSEVTAFQAAYNRISIIYPTAEEAQAALEKGVKLKREYKYSFGTRQTDETCKPYIDFENKNIINIDKSFVKNQYYIVFADGLNGAGVPLFISWESEPAYITLEYENAYMSSKGGKDITGLKSLTYCDATPCLYLYDSSDVIIGKLRNGGTFECGSGVGGTVRFVKNNTVGTGSLTSTATGIVRLSSLTSEITVYAQWKSNDGKTVVTSNYATAKAEEYVIPSLGGFIEAAVATNRTGDDIIWDGGETCMANVPAGTTTSVLFYFLGSDGKKYSGCADAYSAADINRLNPTEYRFYYRMLGDDTSCADITKSGKLTTYKEGTACVEILLLEKGKSIVTDKADTIGLLQLNITEAPELCDMYFEEDRVEVDKDDSEVSDIRLPFELSDQYGELYSAVKDYSKIKIQSNTYGVTPSLVWNDSTKTKGSFKVNLSGKAAGTYTFVIKYQKYIDHVLEDIFSQEIEITLY